MAASPVDLREILLTLTRKRIPFVLTGAHGIGTWTGRPRDTQDVDILVRAGRNYGRAVKALRALYPQLEAREFPGLTALFLPGERHSVIDVVYPHRADIEATLAHPVWVASKGLKYRIPSLEAALANKYGAMLTPTRHLGKRIYDLGDFTLMVQHSTDEGRRAIDPDKLHELGEKVRPGGGGDEILGLVETIKRDEPVDLKSLMTRTGVDGP